MKCVAPKTKWFEINISYTISKMGVCQSIENADGVTNELMLGTDEDLSEYIFDVLWQGDKSTLYAHPEKLKIITADSSRDVYISDIQHVKNHMNGTLIQLINDTSMYIEVSSLQKKIDFTTWIKDRYFNERVY